MNEITPGPWKIYDAQDPLHIKIKGKHPGYGGAHVADVLGIENARMVTAAPDLLEALKNTLSLLKVFTRETDDVAKVCWDQAEAAISKATGTR